jgi:putative transposase
MDHKGWHSRGYLPHFDSQDVVQFVTFRLADSLPKEAALRLRDAAQPESLRDEFLDKGWGACWLRDDRIAEIVEQAFLIFDAERYRLHAWTIMPNHVHVLLSVLPGRPLGDIVSSWKRFTAREANIVLGRAGAFWQVDYWDRFIRNEEHFSATESYIDLNPVKAGLVAEAHLWPRGSARLR